MLSYVRNLLGPRETRSSVVVGPTPNKYVGRIRLPDANVDVDADSAQQVSAVTACVDLICDDIAGLPVRIVQHVGKERKRVGDHYLLPLLNDEPNDYMSADTWKRIALRSLLLRGRSGDWLDRSSRDFRVLSIHPLHPSQFQAKITETDFYYSVSNYGRKRKFPDVVSPASFLHCVYISDDGIEGKSPIDVACSVVANAIAADRQAGRFFGHGSTMNGYLKSASSLKPEAEDEVAKSWNERTGGVDNAYSIPVISGDIDFVPLSVTPEQSQLLATRAYSVVDICRLYRVSPPLIGDLSKSSWSTYDAVQAAHANSCIRPWCYRLENEWTRKFLSEEEKRAGLRISIDVNGLMRGDRQSQDKSFAVGRQFGWYSINDVRRFLDEEEVEGGDQYHAPLNMGAVGPTEEDPQKDEKEHEAVDQESAEEGTEDRSVEKLETEQRRRDADRLNPLLHDAVRRMLTKEANAVRRAKSKDLDLVEWSQAWYEPHVDLVRSAVLPAFTAFDPASASGRSADYATLHVETSKRDIADAVAFDALDLLYQRWTETRPYKLDLMEDRETRA